MREGPEIRLIDAGRGDCVVLRYRGVSGAFRNLVFDSGPQSAHREFELLVDSLRLAGERIDLMVITHQDDDHLGGLLKALKDGRITADDIGLLVMNSDEAATPGAFSDDELLSAEQRVTLYRLARNCGINTRTRIVVGDSLSVDGAIVSVLAPTEKERIPRGGKGQDEGVLSARGDWSASIVDLLDRQLPPQDSSPSNRSSIVVTVEIGLVRVLMTGDAPADRFLPQLACNGRPTRFDIVKLPHHGSARNICAAWSDYIDCARYIICADGRSHPDKTTIARATTWGDDTTIYSPTEWWTTDLMEEIDNASDGTLHLVRANAIELGSEGKGVADD